MPHGAINLDDRGKVNQCMEETTQIRRAVEANEEEECLEQEVGRYKQKQRGTERQNKKRRA